MRGDSRRREIEATGAEKNRERTGHNGKQCSVCIHLGAGARGKTKHFPPDER